LALSEELSHPYSQTFAVYFAAWQHAILRDAQRAEECAAATVALATEHGFSLLAAGGTVIRGWARALQEPAPDGLAELLRGLDAYRATGAEFLRPYQLALLADVYAHQGHVEDALTALTNALELVGKTDERWWESELHRVKGELLWRQAEPDVAKVEHCFETALEVARHQGAKFLELRAAVSLSRLRVRLGRRAEAYDLLTRIYGWFPESLDSPDLRKATPFSRISWGNNLVGVHS
jgi:predicted ATPase